MLSLQRQHDLALTLAGRINYGSRLSRFYQLASQRVAEVASQSADKSATTNDLLVVPNVCWDRRWIYATNETKNMHATNALRFSSRMVAAISFAACLCAAAAAQSTVEPAGESVPTPAGEGLTLADIESRRKAAEESTDLTDEVKKKIAELYRQAQEQLQQAEQAKKQSAEYKAAADNVQQRAVEIRRMLAQIEAASPADPPDAALAELEQKLSAAELQLKEQKDALAKLEAEPASRAGRRKEIRSQLLSAPQKLEDVKKQLQTAAPSDEPTALSLARQSDLLSRRKLLDQLPPALQSELSLYDAEEAADVIRLQRDLLAQQIGLQQKEFELLNASVRRKRDAQAQAAVQRAQEEAVQAQPLLKPYAEENTRLAEEAKDLTEQISAAEQKLKNARQRLEDVQRQLSQTRKKVENVGLTGAIGLMLRKQRAELPNVRRRLTNIDERRQLIDAAQFALFEYDDQRSSLANSQPLVSQIIASAGPQLSVLQRRLLEDSARHVLANQREFLDALIRSYRTYFDTLVELDTTERQLVNLTKEYQNYIDERVLWIRSAKPLYADLRIDQSDMQVVNRQQWQTVWEKLRQDVTGNPLLYAVAIAAFFTLLRLGFRGRRTILAMGELASRSTCYKFVPTLRAALATLAVALPWPALLLFLCWRLSQVAANGDDLARGLAQGLWACGWVVLLLDLMRHVCRPEGLGEAHFDWPEAITRDLRRNLRQLMIFGVPLVFVLAALQAVDPQHGRDVLERGGFLLGTIVFAAFLYWALSPRRGIFREYLAYHPGGWVDRLKHVWFWGGVAFPFVLAGLSLLGFHYTARQLTLRLFVSLHLLVMLLLLRAFLMRLILVARRKLVIAEARRRRAEAEQSGGEQSGALSPQQLVADDEQYRNLSTQSEQTRRLVATGMVVSAFMGLWLIWSDVVPALGFLDRWPLWTTTVTVTETVATTEDGPAVTASRQRVESITLADVGLATIIAIVTFVAARNVPGLMEMSLLSRLPLENSVRYAITTLVSYGIVLVGILIGCNTIGLRWTQIQWLATALTFGLAFGLQEMFANFVAGLILLFERPIRVGDVVTVDDVTGVVSRIRIRATTITNWDRKDFVVPNKEFITGKVLNWTLSDNVNRIVIEVGVAYGSNTQLVRELLLKAAQEHPLILETPPSIATFEGFGDSCLNFVLRTFLPSMENRLPVIHDLHMAIDKMFREAEIEIAFPQRDLHIRTVPSDLQLHRSTTASNGSNGNGAHQHDAA